MGEIKEGKLVEDDVDPFSQGFALSVSLNRIISSFLRLL